MTKTKSTRTPAVTSASRPYGVRFTRTRDGETLSTNVTRYAQSGTAQDAADKANALPAYTDRGATYDVTAVVLDD